MENKRKNIRNIMKELLNLYEQVGNVAPKSSRLIIEDYISTKEKELIELLNNY